MAKQAKGLKVIASLLRDSFNDYLIDYRVDGETISDGPYQTIDEALGDMAARLRPDVANTTHPQPNYSNVTWQTLGDHVVHIAAELRDPTTREIRWVTREVPLAEWKKATEHLQSDSDDDLPYQLAAVSLLRQISATPETDAQYQNVVWSLSKDEVFISGMESKDGRMQAVQATVSLKDTWMPRLQLHLYQGKSAYDAQRATAIDCLKTKQPKVQQPHYRDLGYHFLDSLHVKVSGIRIADDQHVETIVSAPRWTEQCVIETRRGSIPPDTWINAALYFLEHKDERIFTNVRVAMDFARGITVTGDYSGDHGTTTMSAHINEHEWHEASAAYGIDSGDYQPWPRTVATDVLRKYGKPTRIAYKDPA